MTFVELEGAVQYFAQSHRTQVNICHRTSQRASAVRGYKHNVVARASIYGATERVLQNGMCGWSCAAFANYFVRRRSHPFITARILGVLPTADWSSES